MKTRPSIPNKPKIPDYCYAVPVGDDRLQFRMGARVVRLGGEAVSKLFPKLLPLLNGRYQLPEILAELKEFKQETVLAALAALAARGLLEDAALAPSFDISWQELERYHSHFAFFARFSDDRYEYQSILKSAQVVVLGLGQLGSQVLSCLATCGVGTIKAAGDGVVGQGDVGAFFTEQEVGKTRCEAAQARVAALNPYVQVEPVEMSPRSAQDVMALLDGADLAIVCTDGPAVSLLRWVNEACLAQRVRWTSATLNEKEATIGPSIVPFETACYTCYELRKKANETYYEEYLAFEEYVAKNPDLVRECGNFLPLVQVVGGYVVWEAVRMLTNLAFPATCGRTCTVDFTSLETDIEQVLKLPYCPTCSQAKPKPTLWTEE